MKKRKITFLFVILCMALIPVIYSSLFLGALMDPYGKVSKLPVAVVSTTNNPVQSAIHSQSLFDSKVETPQQAQNALKNGKVYAIIEFDKDFNQDLTHYPLTKKHPEVKLITSEGLGYTTTKILKNTMFAFITKMNQSIYQQYLQSSKINSIQPLDPEVLQLKNIETHAVPNNGTAMAPYIFSLTLFVGGIFVSQFVMRVFSRKNLSLKKYWLIEFGIPLLIGMIQAILLFVIGSSLLKIHMDQPLAVIPFFVLVSASFTSIIVGLNKLIPGIGSLLVLLITMLQTSSSGGTYAIQLSGSFFQTINSYLPMTYSINGFKKLISLNNLNVSSDVAVLLALLLIGQLVLFWAYRKNERRIQEV